MDRPVSVRPGTTIGLFKIDGDGQESRRVNVKLGRASVNTIEVIEGLKVGDRVFCPTCPSTIPISALD